MRLVPQMTQQRDVLSRVRKILAKAEDPAATAEEAQTYTAKAAELIAAYGIDRALLAEQVPESDLVGDRVVVVDPPYALDKAGLLSTVAVSLRCAAVRRDRHMRDQGGRRVKQISLHLFGYDSDLLRVEVLYTSLLLQATSQLMRAPVPPWESAAAFRRSWLAGFTAAVGGRLRAAEQAVADAAESGPDHGSRSVELVLLDRTRAAESAMHSEYPDLRVARRRELSGSGGGFGYRAGRRADLGCARMGRSAKGELAG
jgi:hypothetical protein